MDVNKYKYEKEVVYTFPFCFLLIEYVFGFYLNDIFPSLFSYTDEILAIILLFWTIKYAVFKKKQSFSKETNIFAGVAIFYLLYSFYIHSNIPVAICTDFLIQIKPFIAYFMFGYIGFILNSPQKNILKKISVFLFLITATIALVGVFSLSLMNTLYYVYGHATNYGTALVLIGLTYLFCSNVNNKKDLVVFVLILTFSLLSFRSKIYGFYSVILFLVFFKDRIELKISLKNIIIASCMIVIAVYAAWNKVNFYFVDFNIEDEDSIARPMLYVVSWQMLFDYFPFGSGLASFGTYYSGVHYSSIYEDYGLNNVWGLSRDFWDFVSDVHFAAVAQFGFFGLGLFSLFWTRIIILANKLKKKSRDNKNYLVIIIILIFLFIESVAGTLLTANRGFYIMILLSLAFNEAKDQIAIFEENPKDELI